jgi:hypothetical protein
MNPAAAKANVVSVWFTTEKAMNFPRVFSLIILKRPMTVQLKDL